MKQLLNAFAAENIKLKHSGIRTTAIILAIITPLLGLGMSIYSFFTETATTTEPIYIFFETYYKLKTPFINLFFPLIVIVTASRIAQIEYKNNTWQLMETQPVKRAILLNAKFLKAYSICIASIVVYMLGVVLVSVIDYALSPKSDLYILDIQWLFLLKRIISLSFGTGFLLAVIYAVSVRFSNFFVSIIVGVGALLVAPILTTFGLLPKWFPTTILDNSLIKSSDLGYWLTYNEYLSLLATIIVMFIITFWYVFKSKKWWITNKSTAVLKYALPIFVLLGVFSWVNKPTKMLQSNETVIKGTVPENTTISAIYLLDGMMNDTLQTIPVTNNHFRYVIKEDMPLKNYRLIWWTNQGEYRQNVLFTNNDVIEIQFPDETKDQPFKILGTRLAENSLNVSLSNNLSYIRRLASNGSEINSEIIIYSLKKSYKQDLKTINKFHTADNFTIRDDYEEIIKNELFYTYNRVWLQYKDLVLRTNPDYEHKDKTIQDILEIDFQPNEDLIAKAENIEYFRFKIYDLLRQNTTDDDILSKYQQGLQETENPSLQTQLAKIILYDNLDAVNDLSELNRYENIFLPFIKEPRAYAYYSKFIDDKKRLTTGNNALNFKAKTVSNEIKTLADFKGKYIVLDFWASWCGPCLYQSDYFEKHAIEYNKRGDVVFISLSIDQKEADWRKKVKLNDKNVVQLFALNQSELTRFYRLNSIPRFAVIDPEGKIVNSSFPFPDDSNFKIMLNQLLPEK